MKLVYGLILCGVLTLPAVAQKKPDPIPVDSNFLSVYHEYQQQINAPKYKEIAAEQKALRDQFSAAQKKFAASMKPLAAKYNKLQDEMNALDKIPLDMLMAWAQANGIKGPGICLSPTDPCAKTMTHYDGKKAFVPPSK